MRQEGGENKVVPLYISISVSGPERKIPMDFQKVSRASQSERVAGQCPSVPASEGCEEGGHVRSPWTKLGRDPAIHTPAVPLCCLFSFSYPLLALVNLPFLPAQLKFTGKHNLGNPKGPVGPIQASSTPNPRARY